MNLDKEKLDFPCWPIFLEEEDAFLLDSLSSGFWSGSRGEYLKKVTQSFLDLQGASHGIPLMNGTVTMETALHALDITLSVK
ncbi:MAG: DegT/DnrJ/EryC1/StrS family aminotransferase [Culicoidibacterales bacterium]